MERFSDKLLLIYGKERDIILARVLCQVSSVSQQERRPCAYWVVDLRGQQSTRLQQSTELQLCFPHKPVCHRNSEILKQIRWNFSPLSMQAKIKHGQNWPNYIDNCGGCSLLHIAKRKTRELTMTSVSIISCLQSVPTFETNYFFLPFDTKCFPSTSKRDIRITHGNYECATLCSICSWKDLLLQV